MIERTLLRIVGYFMNEAAAVGESIETGAQLEHLRDRVMKVSGDAEHHNYHFVVGGPSLYAQHQILGNRWVLMAAWRDELHTQQLHPDENGRHRLVVVALDQLTR